MNARIEALKTTKVFSDGLVLKEMDFSLLSGEIHASAWKDSAGKPMLMLIMTGVYQPDDEAILFTQKT